MQTGGGNAIDIVIAIETNLLPLMNGLLKPVNAFFHVWQKKWIMPLPTRIGQPTTSLARIPHPTTPQHLGSNWRKSQGIC
jgi:hypothetical protein